MDIASLCYDLEKSSDVDEWRFKLSKLIQIVKQRPRDIRPQCIAVSSVCNRAISLFKDELIRRRAVSCLSEMAYDEAIVVLWSIDGAEVDTLVEMLKEESGVVRTLAKEALARWSSPLSGRTDPLVRFLIDRLRNSENSPTEIMMKSLVHLCTELLGGEDRIDGDRLFREAVHAAVSADDEYVAIHRALILLHLSEGEDSNWKPWVELTSHFIQRRGALLDTAYHHASIQRIFFQEVMVKFSLDTTARLGNASLSGYQKLSVVIGCLADHLEDFESRLDTRQRVYCERTGQNVVLSPEKRADVYDHMTQLLSAPLIVALGWALAERIPPELEEDQNRKCYLLLEEKTRITAENHDQLEEVQDLAYRCVAMAEKASELIQHIASALLIDESHRFLHISTIGQLRHRLEIARQEIPGGELLPRRHTRSSSTFM